MFRVLKPGGRLLVLEFSNPVSEVIAKLADLYSFKLLPKMGEIVANDSESYKYLAESIRMHPDQQTLAGMMEQVGFEQVGVYNLTQGVVALHRGYKFKVAYADGCHGHRGDRNQPQPVAGPGQTEPGAVTKLTGKVLNWSCANSSRSGLSSRSAVWMCWPGLKGRRMRC